MVINFVGAKGVSRATLTEVRPEVWEIWVAGRGSLGNRTGPREKSVDFMRNCGWTLVERTEFYNED